jgi:hypothetical protein
MIPEQADEIFEQINELASQIENDEELKIIDGRYSITAKWIETDIENASV